MNPGEYPYRIFPLGDIALCIDFGNRIDENINKLVMARFADLRMNPIPGMIEAVPAYSSLAIYYDTGAIRRTIPAGSTAWEWMKGQTEKWLKQPLPVDSGEERLVKIPVCYADEFAPDLQRSATMKKLTAQEFVQVHTSRQYRVYMLGFLPGFAYMGELDERIIMPRKSHPVTVAPGSVAIAGKQTGIYPLPSPGGWQIIGRSPLKLFDIHPHSTYDGSPCLLQPGDMVQFYSITIENFHEIHNALTREEGS